MAEKKEEMMEEDPSVSEPEEKARKKRASDRGTAYHRALELIRFSEISGYDDIVKKLEEIRMEKRMQEAMEAAKAEKETIRLPITGNGDDDVFVSVNGYKYLIQRGKEVEVPRFVAEVLRNSENQKAATYRMMEEMQKKAEDGTGQFL